MPLPLRGQWSCDLTDGRSPPDKSWGGGGAGAGRGAINVGRGMTPHRHLGSSRGDTVPLSRVEFTKRVCFHLNYNEFIFVPCTNRLHLDSSNVHVKF